MDVNINSLLNVFEWTVEDVLEWLQLNDLGVLINNFKEKNINGQLLLNTTEKEYEDLGITLITGGKQIKFGKKLSELIENQPKLNQQTTLQLSETAQQQQQQQQQQQPIQLQNYHITPIGKGGFGEVFKLIHKVDSSNVKAMKKIHLKNNSKIFKRS